MIAILCWLLLGVPLAKERRDIIESVQPYNIPELAPEEMAVSINRNLGILPQRR
jgi:hypothetical protein